MMPTVVYHWWAGPNEQPAYSNMSHPILLSIATLRSVNPNIPIKVLNISNYPPHYDKSTDPWTNSDWMHFQKTLKFDVVPTNFHLEEHYSHIVGYQLLSRLFDIRKPDLSHETIIYCDSDVFWLKNPLPLECNSEKFCFDGFNSGFFYYNHQSPVVQEMFSVFDSYSITALRNQKFCDIIKESTNYNSWPYIWDETILRYMNETGMSHMFEIIPDLEHGVLRKIHNLNPDQLKMLHCNGMMIKNPTAKRITERDHSRGLACLLFKEFYDNITKVLTEKDLKLIFTESELETCLSQQMSLFDIDKINNAKCDDGTFNFIIKSPVQWLI